MRLRIVKESGAGILIEPGDFSALAQEVLELKKNYKKGEIMGFAGRAYSEDIFLWMKPFQNMRKVFFGVMNLNKK